MSEARYGPELIRATKPHSAEQPARTWRLLLLTFAVTAVAGLVAGSASLGPLRWVGTLVLGLVNVRIFIFFHDAMHGAIFRRSPLGKLIMHLYGLGNLTPARVWKDSHNYHHAHTAKIVGASIGSYPVMTVRMHERASRGQRLMYRLVRSPLNMACGYVTVFLLGMCIRPLLKNFRRNWTALMSLAVHFSIIAVLYRIGGIETVLAVVVIPMIVSCALGSYLFYAQHNFPGIKMRDRRDWEYTDAAIHASSMMVGGPLMRWITGDIGFHHVHHLNSQIPFYRLEEAMENVPELQSPATTSLSPSDVRACLRGALWDPEQGRMVSYTEARHAQRAAAAAVS